MAIKEYKNFKIESGSRVAVVGGGPAGSLFTLYLRQYAMEKGIKPDITVYQNRKFEELGPRGCKGCAGVLPMTFLHNLEQLGLSIPQDVVRCWLEKYAVHSPYTNISISNPEKDTKIASIYRGGGPRISNFIKPISFDGWLLQEVRQRNINVENDRVTGIFLNDNTAIEVAGKKIIYDLIVLAAGANIAPLTIQGLDYVSPRTVTMSQQELFAGEEEVEAKLGKVAHAFLIPDTDIVFGTLVPKGPFINVSVLSRNRHRVSVNNFLSNPLVKEMLPEHYTPACGCQPRAAVSIARNYYSDRFVVIGDAAATRLYKDGVGSALLTAREAARTAIYHGISGEDFKRHYQPLCSSIEKNNRWGRIFFSIINNTKSSRTFLFTQHRLISAELNNNQKARPFTKAAWGMFTGSYGYSRIARMVFNPVSLMRLLGSFILTCTTLLFSNNEPQTRKLYIEGRKVLILGSGFGGTYVLRKLVPALNRNENVETTMVSNTNYFLFSPLLHEVSMGQIETRHISYPIRRLHWRDRFNFIHADVTNIDLEARKVMTTAGTFSYDYLVLTLGSVTDTSALESAGKNVFFLKTLRDAMLLKNHVIQMFEQAARTEDPELRQQLLTFAIAGAGYTGVQLAAELRDFVHDHLLRFYRNISPSFVRIILLEIEPKIIASLHTKLGAYVMNYLRKVGIEVRLKSKVTKIWDDRLEVNKIEIIPTNTLVWMTGIVASPQIASLKAEKDRIGRVMVNDYLEIPDFPNVFAGGDCAHFTDPKSGRPIAPLAHNAVRQAKVIAYNILADIRGTGKKKYHYTEAPQLVSLGVHKAVLRLNRIRLYGWPASIIWLAAYTFLVTGQYNQVRILLDRLLSIIFGRDTTLIDLKK